jgi:hypothetical protein
MKMIELIFRSKLPSFNPMLRRDLDIGVKGINGSPPPVGKVLRNK